MSLNKKYANLPDLDAAPDVYETPDLTDGGSTAPTGTLRTADSDDELPSNPDIDRHGLNADDARNHFLRATVDSRDVDFSDTIATKRKAYRSRANRSRRRREDGTEEVGDLSDSEEETFERRLARLRRETEELKDEYERRQHGDFTDATTEEERTKNEEPTGDGILELSRALDGIHASTRASAGTTLSADAALSQKISTASSTTTAPTDGANSQTAASEAPAAPASTTSSSLLDHAASFDSRLALVEAALGISTASNPFIPETQTGDAPLQPVLPTLDHLASRLSALASLLGNSPSDFSSSTATASLHTNSNIEALASRIKKLTVEAEALSTARKRATEAANRANAAGATGGGSKAQDLPLDISTSSSPTTVHTEPDTGIAPPFNQQQQNQQQNDEQTSKIHALYTTLPTIQSLHPLLPSVLDRLRSLRAIHAGAATAAETLDTLEKRQADMKSEIEQWREGLKAVEEKMQAGEAAMKKNVDIVGPWVKELEKRLDTLGV